MKYIIFIGLLNFNINVFSQTLRNVEPKCDCSTVSSIFKNRKIIDHFRLKKLKSSVIFVDTFNFFECSRMMILGKEVIFTNTYSKDIADGERSYFNLKDQDQRYIVLKDLSKINEKYKLVFWQPNDNSAFTIELTFKKSKTKIRLLYISVY